jgi:hypothetical protein
MRGQTSVLGGTVRPVSEDAAGGKPWAFEITFAPSISNGAMNSPYLQKGTDKDLMFAAKSSAEREEWMSAISQASVRSRPSPSSVVSKSTVAIPPQIQSTPPRPPSVPVAEAPAAVAGLSAPPEKYRGQQQGQGERRCI